MLFSKVTFFCSKVLLFGSYISCIPLVRRMVPFILEMYFSKFVQFSPFIHVCLLFYCSGFSKFSSKQLVQGLEWFDNSVLFKYKSAKQNSDYCSDGKHKFINCQRTKVVLFDNFALKRKPFKKWIKGNLSSFDEV